MTARGKFVLTVLILAVVGFGAWRWYQRQAAAPPGAGPGAPDTTTQAATPAGEPGPADATAPTDADADAAVATVETLSTPPQLAAPAAYTPKDDVIDLDLSEYAGYAGLIVANGGLEPNPESYFTRQHGFRVAIRLSEEETWSDLNAGRLAASVTTVDVLAVLGRQFQVVVPAQIGFSRGADGIVVRRDIRRINDLKGKVLVATQFTETDFLLRYLAQEASLDVGLLPGLNVRPDPERVNLVFAADGFAAGDLFLADLKSGRNRLAGCVTWDPKTTEVARASGGQAHVLVTNRNLLVIADILVVNRPFAERHPAMVKGLVDGLIWGNSQLRENREAHLPVVAKAFAWEPQETREALDLVHLANLPENQAFFSGTIDAAGSFGGIFQMSLFAYGAELAKANLDPQRFLDLKALEELAAAGTYAGQRVDIAPIRSGTLSPIESNPLLSKDIRFFFEPNSAVLQADSPDNAKNLDALRQMLAVAPGSMILLRGHVDDSLVPEFRQQGGENFVRQMALKAAELSKNRASEVRRHLVEKHRIAPERVETVGLGWSEPAGKVAEKNRRVEAQWFTVE